MNDSQSRRLVPILAGTLMLTAGAFSVRVFTQSQSAAPAQKSAAAKAAASDEDQESAAKMADLARYMEDRKPRYVLEDSYLRWPLNANAQQYASIDGQHIKSYLKEVTAISRQSQQDGEQYWGRIAGTKYDLATEDWLMKKFQGIGLTDVRKQEFDLPPQWFGKSWEVSLSGAGGVKLASAFPFTGTPATPAAGLDLETVYVGLGREADFVGRNLQGKAAVVFSIPMPGVRDNSAQWFGAVERAQKNHAAAVFVVLGLPGNISAQTAQPKSTAPAVPTFLLGNDDGMKVLDAIDKALPGPGPHIKVRLDASKVPGLKTAIVWGVLPGATDENILIQSTLDSFFEGAMDNASGLATMVSLAEYYSKIPQAQRRRTIIFAGTPAHHAGDPGVQWMHDHKDTFFAKTALIINCVHIAQTQTYVHGPFMQLSNATEAHRWTLRGSPKFDDIIVKAYQEFGVATFDVPDARGAGAMSKIYKDAPSLMIYEMGPFYHTSMDSPDMVPAPGLEAGARAYARIIDEINKLDRQALQAPADAP
jgi:hypothetical protein